MEHKVWTSDKINNLSPGQQCTENIFLFTEAQSIDFEEDATILCRTADNKEVVCHFDVDPRTSGLKELHSGDIVAIRNAVVGDGASEDFTDPNLVNNYLGIVEETTIYRYFDNHKKQWLTSPQSILSV
uniref:Uncharacterized protein n=1 Tax=Panagrolaimus sp. JU765 TaxID=591449 RepID=A0AC34Q4T5_9BILA